MISDAFFAEKATEYNLFSNFRCLLLILRPVLTTKATEIDNLFDLGCFSEACQLFNQVCILLNLLSLIKTEMIKIRI